jgi:hypothetical protein
MSFVSRVLYRWRFWSSQKHADQYTNFLSSLGRHCSCRHRLKTSTSVSIMGAGAIYVVSAHKA